MNRGITLVTANNVDVKVTVFVAILTSESQIKGGVVSRTESHITRRHELQKAPKYKGSRD